MFFAPVTRRAYAPAFERFLADATMAPTRSGYKVEQDDKGFTITIDVPGLAKDQLQIGVEGAIVRIESKPEAKRQYKAAYELPQDIDADASVATLENGELTLKLAKKQPVSNVRQIAVN